jgi:acyl-CoA thioesterase-1
MTRFARYGLAALLVHCFAAAPAHAGPLVWAFGDSLTEGYGLPPQQGFTVQLQGALRRAGINATVANGGVSGDTARQALARLRWGLRGLPRAPDLVVVELGANDMLRGLPPAQAQASLDAILAELTRRHLPVLLTGMRASPNLGPDYRRQFDAIYPALARRYHTAFYPFFYNGIVGRAALIQADGLHPNAQGVRIIVARMAPSVIAALRQSNAGPRPNSPASRK